MCDIRYKVLWVDDLTGTQDEILQPVLKALLMKRYRSHPIYKLGRS